MRARRRFAAQPQGVIFSGGPASVIDAESPRAPQLMFDSGVPLLGICYGQQTLHQQLGGKVDSSEQREFGRAFIEIVSSSALFDGLWEVGERHQVWMSHGDHVTQLPAGFQVTAPRRAHVRDADRRERSAASMACSSIPRSRTRRTAESSSRNFLFDVCGCRATGRMAASSRGDRRDPRAGRPTGGSSAGCRAASIRAVAAVLVHEAIGDRLTCIFVDNGLLRYGEAEQVVELFRNSYSISAGRMSTRRRTFSAGSPASATPNRNARSSARVHRRLRRTRRRRSAASNWLAQGTLYPDVIETVSFTRRSVGDDQEPPQRRRPARADEDRSWSSRCASYSRTRSASSAASSGSRAIVGRHPFPGPGLAIRILGDITPEKVRHCCRRPTRSSSKKFATPGSTTRSGRRSRCSCRSLGRRDGRLAHLRRRVALRAVTSHDGMTADWARAPVRPAGPSRRRASSTRCRGVNRVVYDISSKPPTTIEWE